MTTQYMNRPNGTIAYDDRGQGPLVIAAPSLGDLRGEYRFLAPRLAEAGYRVVTMDVRGHGESSVGWDDYSVAAVGDDLLALIQHLNAGPALIIGTSMAGGAAVYAAAEAPDRVSGIILINPFVRNTIDKMPAWVSRVLFSTLFSGPWALPFWLKYYASLYPTQKPADFPEYLSALRANLGEPGRLNTVLRMMLASKQASEERLERVRVPTLILMGSRDPDFKDPAGEAQLIASRLTGTQAEVQILDGAGHYPHAEMPEAAAAAILAFANTLRERTGHVA